MSDFGFSDVFGADVFYPESYPDQDPIPDGWHYAYVSGWQYGEIFGDKGTFIRVEFSLLGKGDEGRKSWQKFSTGAKDDVVKYNARKDFACFLTAIGESRFRDPDDLLGRHLSFHLKTSKVGQGRTFTTIDGYRPMEEDVPSETTVQPSSSEPKQ